MGRRPSLAIVVQRYGADINGGAELHARYVAEHLAAHADVRVLTTCARDYVTWRNELPPGVETVHGYRWSVSRWHASATRTRRIRPALDSRLSPRRIRSTTSSAWLDAQGPVSPGLLGRARTRRHEFDFVLVFSLRYHGVFHGARAARATRDSRSHDGARGRDGTVAVSTGAARRARRHVQLVRRAGADPRARRATSTSLASSWASAPRFPRGPTANAHDTSSDCATGSSCTWGASTRTRGAPNLFGSVSRRT